MLLKALVWERWLGKYLLAVSSKTSSCIRNTGAPGNEQEKGVSHNTVSSYGGSAIVRPLKRPSNMQDTPFALLQAPLSVNETTATRSLGATLCLSRFKDRAIFTIQGPDYFAESTSASIEGRRFCFPTELFAQYT